MSRKHDRVFGPLPVGRPLDRGFENVIELEEGLNPIITTPYRNPKRFKDEIENVIKDLLDMRQIDQNLDQGSKFSSKIKVFGIASKQMST